MLKYTETEDKFIRTFLAFDAVSVFLHKLVKFPGSAYLLTFIASNSAVRLLTMCALEMLSLLLYFYVHLHFLFIIIITASITTLQYDI